MPDPLISVIIPAYNCAHYLGEAIDSVLTQDYPRLEVIVVDDGSSDNTQAVLDHYQADVSRLYQDNQGIGAARNAGQQRARGEFIAFLDADDLYLPGKLSRQMACFEADPALECVQGHLEQFISPELEEAFAATVKVDTGKSLAAPMAGTCMIKRQALARVGPWPVGLTVGTDLDWYARVQEQKVSCLMLEETLLRRRIHRTNTNLVHKADNHERLHVLKAMLDRRRAIEANTS